MRCFISLLSPFRRRSFLKLFGFVFPSSLVMHGHVNVMISSSCTCLSRRCEVNFLFCLMPLGINPPWIIRELEMGKSPVLWRDVFSAPSLVFVLFVMFIYNKILVSEWPFTFVFFIYYLFILKKCVSTFLYSGVYYLYQTHTVNASDHTAITLSDDV